MRRAALAAALAAVLAGCWPAPDPPAGTGGESAFAPCDRGAPEVCDPFGIRMDPPAWDLVTGTLRVPLFRPPTITLDDGACSACAEAAAHGLRLVLVVRAGGAPGTPGWAPADLPAYEARLAALLDTWRDTIALLVVEEGSDDPALWADSTDAYLALLTSACTVARSRAIPCTDAGLSSTGATLLIAAYLASAGHAETAAAGLVASSFDNPEVRAHFPAWPPSAADVAAGIAAARPRLDAAARLLAGVRAAGVDLANLRFREHDIDAFDLAVALVRGRTGCVALATTEIAQRTQDRYAVLHLATDAAELGLRVVVWSAVAGDAPLLDASGALTEDGAALAEITTTEGCED